MTIEERYERMRLAVETPPEGIKDLVKRNSLKYVTAEDIDFDGNFTRCYICNQPVKRGILNMADHKCKLQ